jgi:FAD/FMN-containing dehydrogenase
LTVLGAVPVAGCTSPSTSTGSGSPRKVASTASVPRVPAGSPAATPVAPATTPIAPASTPIVRQPPIRTLDELARRMDGRLVRRRSTGYAVARLGYDTVFDGHQPVAIAQCHSPADVQRCLELVANTGVPVAARSGGHSYAGYSTPPNGLVIDLAAMSGVQIERDGTARIGAGARLAEVYTALGRAGRRLPGGSCPTVGIGGLTLGGGVGFLARADGLTCDRLVSAEVVTPDGVLRRVDASEDADLFWALRGGGGGNFGVVTAFTFRTAPAPEVVRFALDFDYAASAAVFAAWQEWIVTMPDELTAGCAINSPGQGCTVAGMHLGSEKAARSHLADLVRRAGWQPSSQLVTPMSLVDAMYDFAYCGGLRPGQCAPSWTGAGAGVLGRSAFVGTSRILYTATDATALLAAIGDGSLAVLVESISGAAGRVPADATAFPHRSALGVVQLYAGGSDRSTISELRDRLAGPLGPWGYVNYIDPTMPRSRRAYYGANLTRLQATARRYDPDRVLAFAQSVS